MMKELLEGFFGQHFNSPKRACVDCENKIGTFVCSDIKACNKCMVWPADVDSECNRVIFKCDSADKVVEVIQLESFLANYSNLELVQNRKRCDLLLAGESKVAFCELSCINPLYLDRYYDEHGSPKTGKREKAKNQLRDSIGLLLSVPEISAEINLKSDRIALFAYRRKAVIHSDDLDRKVSNQIRSFGQRIEKSIREPMYSQMSNGFLFIEVPYPETYIW